LNFSTLNFSAFFKPIDYNQSMNTLVTQTLERLAQRLNALPDEAQSDFLAELESRVDSLDSSHLSTEQRATVLHRLSKPRHYAAPADVAALLHRFNS
jgi:hypothetical protein